MVSVNQSAPRLGRRDTSFVGGGGYRRHGRALVPSNPAAEDPWCSDNAHSSKPIASFRRTSSADASEDASAVRDRAGQDGGNNAKAAAISVQEATQRCGNITLISVNSPG